MAMIPAMTTGTIDFMISSGRMTAMADTPTPDLAVPYEAPRPAAWRAHPTTERRAGPNSEFKMHAHVFKTRAHESEISARVRDKRAGPRRARGSERSARPPLAALEKSSLTNTTPSFTILSSTRTSAPIRADKHATPSRPTAPTRQPCAAAPARSPKKKGYASLPHRN